MSSAFLAPRTGQTLQFPLPSGWGRRDAQVWTGGAPSAGCRQCPACQALQQASAAPRRGHSLATHAKGCGPYSPASAGPRVTAECCPACLEPTAPHANPRACFHQTCPACLEQRCVPVAAAATKAVAVARTRLWQGSRGGQCCGMRPEIAEFPVQSVAAFHGHYHHVHHHHHHQTTEAALQGHSLSLSQMLEGRRARQNPAGFLHQRSRRRRHHHLWWETLVLLVRGLSRW